jgi:septal ring factor EnvC (AmiA/AmiB activator)
MTIAKWILGITASLVVAGVGGSVAQVIKVESRVSRLEETKLSVDEKLRDVKSDVKDIRSDIARTRESQARIEAIQEQQLRLLQDLARAKR